jgi:Zn-dependent protease with chaperone function
MIGTLTAIIGLSTLFFTVILSLLGTFNLLTLGLMVVLLNVAQWLIAPYIINAIYRAKEVTMSEEPRLQLIVERLSKKSGINCLNS